MYVKCTKLCILFEKLCTLNIQNYIRSLKIFLHWTYKMVYITWKFVYFEYTIDRVLADDIYIYIYIYAHDALLLEIKILGLDLSIDL